MVKSKLRENVNLAKFTTTGVGGCARYFTEVRTLDEMLSAISVAKEMGVDYFILGGGSNLIISDSGFGGLVIKNSIDGISNGKSDVSVLSGTTLQKLVNYLNRQGFSGLQKLTGIPGSVGGAIYGNAGAYGQAIGDCLKEVKVYSDGKIVRLKREKCDFGYRDSIFKHKNMVIVEASFHFGQKVNPSELIKESDEILKQRLVKYPPGLKCPGSFFKNVLASCLSCDVLKKIPSDKVQYGKIPAGYLLEAVGAKGAACNGVKIADYHGNLFVNQGSATAEDFRFLSEDFARKVKNMFGVKLEPEVQFVGFEFGSI